VQPLVELLLQAPVWTEWFTIPAVMGLILLVGFVGLFAELMAPGHVLPGLIGVTAFGIYFLAHYLAGFSGWDAPLIFFLGLVLLVVEMFVPSFGIFGVLGILSLVFSVIAAARSIAAGVIALSIGLIGAIVLLWILYKFFGFKAKWNKIILRSRQENQQGYTSSRDRSHLLGQVGVTLTPLRPAGWAKFGDQKEDVVSEGERIPADTKVIVIHVEGPKVVVRKLEN
jgi:membrane-bound serine protease (ClpP class)